MNSIIKIFVLEKSWKDEKYYIIDWKTNEGRELISLCAALAFHKSLIGISELFCLESDKHSHRLSRAVQAYYVVYHIFACAMLLDSKYTIYYKKDISAFEEKNINNKSELPEQWRKGN